jgi:DNA-binding transcriptional LysR family regulator
MNIMQIQCFEEVYLQRSMTKAAAKLFISQPAISSAIKELEQEYNVTLFLRTKPLRPTEEGISFHKTASKLLRHYYEADREFHAINEIGSAIRLGVSTSVQALLQTYPESSAIYSQEHYASLGFYNVVYIEKALLNHELDFALMPSIGRPNDSRFRTYPVLKTAVSLYTGENREIASKQSITGDEVLDEPLVVFAEQPMTESEYADMVKDLTGCIHPAKISFTTSSLDNIRFAVQKGNSSVLLMKGLFPGVPGIREIPISGSPEIFISFYMTEDHRMKTSELRMIQKFKKMFTDPALAESVNID